MELRNNNQGDLPPANRYPAIRQATETRNAELQETVDRVKRGVREQTAQADQLGKSLDSIELSAGAKSFVEEASSGRSERIAQLRSAVEDGSLFDRGRLARAAERLLSDSV
ncbi:MAG: flagellar biosynthesis anti-sigma factor FlgM [Planctomycetota bacterium]|nr:flagellar biosynthesis anti-sigma factor FlgM [Planctomycetota bacterium]MDG1984978.1 flagellar biosynthesis anti-sigma factor FlgM [Planctomycetota bacterium]